MTAIATHDLGPPSTPVRRGQIRLLLAVLLLVILAVGSLTFRLTGGRWMMVTTPSMGSAAPVGSMVLTRPADDSDIKVGDVIAFHPSSEPAATYTHRVVEILPHSAGLRTRGDINGSVDPWTVSQNDLIGREVLVLRGVGWLVRALPLLVLGSLVLWAFTRWYVRPQWQGPFRLAGAALMFALAAHLLNPFLGYRVLGSQADGGSAQIAVVSTGLLPIKVQASQGTHVDLRQGQVGTVSTSALDSDGSYHLAATMHLPWLGWLALIAFWVSPLFWCLAVGLPAAPVGPQTEPAAPVGESTLSEVAM